ncbi:hypothetical protein GOODEAATRI_010152 [Goodea atripinnis]|uniref:Uncharacterized protein n=1 Tax=Goodea atripinnis TaxID=208336 RepID=A0ABV0PWS1_9TELE
MRACLGKGKTGQSQHVLLMLTPCIGKPAYCFLLTMDFFLPHSWEDPIHGSSTYAVDFCSSPRGAIGLYLSAEGKIGLSKLFFLQMFSQLKVCFQNFSSTPLNI